MKHGKHRRRVSILYNIRMYDLRVCMYICIQIWTHFHCDSGWKIPTCIEVANASVHQDLALRWARRCRRQSAKEKKQAGGKRESVSIFAKLQVLDYHSKLDATLTSKETMCMQKFPLLLRCRGQLGRLVSPSTGHPRPTATFDMQILSRGYIYILLRRSICLPHDHVKICAHASK